MDYVCQIAMKSTTFICKYNKHEFLSSKLKSNFLSQNQMSRQLSLKATKSPFCLFCVFTAVIGKINSPLRFTFNLFWAITHHTDIISPHTVHCIILSHVSIRSCDTSSTPFYTRFLSFYASALLDFAWEFCVSTLCSST